MPTYSKETALYNTGAIGNDIQAAGQTATNYIGIDGNGIKIANANPTTATTYQLQTSTGTEFVASGDSVAEFGGSGARIGKTDGARISVTPSGISGTNDANLEVMSIDSNGAVGDVEVVQRLDVTASMAKGTIAAEANLGLYLVTASATAAQVIKNVSAGAYNPSTDYLAIKFTNGNTVTAGGGPIIRVNTTNYGIFSAQIVNLSKKSLSATEFTWAANAIVVLRYDESVGAFIKVNLSNSTAQSKQFTMDTTSYPISSGQTITIRYDDAYYIKSDTIAYQTDATKTFAYGTSSTVSLISDLNVTLAYDGNKTFTLTAPVISSSYTVAFYDIFIKGVSYTSSMPLPSFTFGTRSGDRHNFSYTAGESLQTAANHQFVIGKHNNPDINDIFQIGNGTAETLKTIFSVSKTGDVSANNFAMASMTRSLSGSQEDSSIKAIRVGNLLVMSGTLPNVTLTSVNTWTDVASVSLSSLNATTAGNMASWFDFSGGGASFTGDVNAGGDFYISGTNLIVRLKVNKATGSNRYLKFICIGSIS